MNNPVIAKIALSIAVLIVFIGASLFGSPKTEYSASIEPKSASTSPVDRQTATSSTETQQPATGTEEIRDTNEAEREITPEKPEENTAQGQHGEEKIPNTQDETENATETVDAVDPEPPEESPIRPDFATINTETRKSLVNVICSATTQSIVRPITGSGVIIGENGVVLTNAHIAQYLLLANHPEENTIECRLRAGSPAEEAYAVELLYISPSWINANAQKITDEKPTGTGQYDYALLRITESLDSNAPAGDATPYAALPIETAPTTLETDTSVLVAGYPAGFLEGLTIYKNLYASSSVVPIAELFTFIQDTIDLISLGGSIVAQKGASGGAVVDGSGALVGIVVTSSQAAQTGDRDLRAITLNHIDTTLRAETGRTLDEFITDDAATYAHNFQQFVAPQLTNELIDALEN